MALGRLLHYADLLRRSHCLPAAIGHHRLLAVFAGGRFGHENLGIFRQRRDGGTGAGIAGENDDAIGRFETIRIRFVLAGSLAFVKAEVGVLDAVTLILASW